MSATTDARVWTLERDVFRDLTRTAAMASDALRELRSGKHAFVTPEALALLAARPITSHVRSPARRSAHLVEDPPKSAAHSAPAVSCFTASDATHHSGGDGDPRGAGPRRCSTAYRVRV